MSAPPRNQDDRLARLEESMLFGERLSEQLSEQLRAAFAAIDRLTARLDALDRRVGHVQDRLDADDPGPEKPPHSA